MSLSLVDALISVARERPDSLALSWREARWSYRELVTGCNNVAAEIVFRGIVKGSRVSLLMRNSPQYVALYYGTLTAGCVAVPLNVQERANALLRQIEHCGSKILIGDPQHPEWPTLVAALERIGVTTIAVAVEDSANSFDRFSDDMQTSASSEVRPQIGADDLASIIYTSGTTGQPKGVMLSQRNLYSNAQAIIQYLNLSSIDRGLCVLPFHFSYGNSVLHTHLLAGAQLHIEDNFAFPQITLQRMQDEGITGFAGVPSTFALLLGRGRMRDFDLRQLRYVTQAGGAMPRAMIERLHAQIPTTQIFVMYGQTEATARLTYLPAAMLETKLGSVGIPIAGVEIDVRSENRSLPPGDEGEIYARGPNVMLGYWNDPGATSAVLEQGWLRTGDLGLRDEDGYLYITGRAVEMIKVGAFRISPYEVEEVLASAEGVQEVAVTGIPDETLGQAIKAVIVPRAGIKLEILALKAHCRAQLAAYKIPKVVEFAASLPRTSSGKVQRLKLAGDSSA